MWIPTETVSVCLSVFLSCTSLTPSHQIVCQFLVTRFCGCGSCSRKRGGGEDEPLLLITAWSPVSTSGAAYSSILELTLGKTKRRTLPTSTSYYEYKLLRSTPMTSGKRDIFYSSSNRTPGSRFYFNLLDTSVCTLHVLRNFVEEGGGAVGLVIA